MLVTDSFIMVSMFCIFIILEAFVVVASSGDTRLLLFRYFFQSTTFLV